MTPVAEKRLCLDTTGAELMLALAEGERLCFQHRERSESQRYHSAMLIPLIQQALSETGWTLADLEALAINIGPGSFTGIRTGITSIRLMGQFLNLPVYVFNTFELLAAQAPGQTVTVLLDALRGRVYHAALTLGNEGIVYAQPPALIPLEAVGFPENALLLASSSLLPRLEALGKTAEAIEGLGCFTPAAMLTLLARCPEALKAESWEAVLPLYLQEPNITQRKAKPGMLR